MRRSMMSLQREKAIVPLCGKWRSAGVPARPFAPERHAYFTGWLVQQAMLFLTVDSLALREPLESQSS